MSTEDAWKKKKKACCLQCQTATLTQVRDEIDGRRADRQWPLIQADRREATLKKHIWDLQKWDMKGKDDTSNPGIKDKKFWMRSYFFVHTLRIQTESQIKMASVCGCTCACFVRHATSCVSLTAPPPRRPPCPAALLTLRPTGSDKCEMLTWCLVDPSRAPRCCSFSRSFSLSFHLSCSLPETIDTRSSLPLNWSQLIVDGNLCRFWKKSLFFFFQPS